MNFQRKFVTLALILILLFTEACNKKKPVPPPQAQAPTTVAQVLPDEIPETTETPTAEAPPRPEAPPPAKTKPKKSVRTQTAKKVTPPASTAAATTTPPPPAQQAATNNQQQVAALHPPHTGTSESAPDMAIVAAVPSQQASQQKEDTAHMVDATENALKNITRSLSDEEKAMRTQIQSYLQQSRKATADGDYERAYNLAKKAQLLAEALIKK
jgi:ElaB/YqjD/DUF883 family membrane-anchored ribosome-binding protein